LKVEQHFATSSDGTKVPYFQISDDDLELDGRNPTLLDGYGGFEVSRTPVYSPVVGIGWLSRRTGAEIPGRPAGKTELPAGRRGVYVLANIRGGGEYGPEWHTAAMRENRMRCYEDHAAVARDLIDRGVTSPKRLACAGGSNGGLLVGNMLTQYPELFGAVSCGVPLLDMRRYTKLSAGYSWKAEYGDPDVAEDWEFIRKFSPYHLIEPDRDYPPVLFWTATSDDRVGPVQARKMAARMQSQGIEDVCVFEDPEGGHSAATATEQTASTRARSYRFLWNSLTGEKVGEHDERYAALPRRIQGHRRQTRRRRCGHRRQGHHRGQDLRRLLPRTRRGLLRPRPGSRRSPRHRRQCGSAPTSRRGPGRLRFGAGHARLLAC